MTALSYDVADETLADEGVRRIEWADAQMPVLADIRERFARERPLEGMRIGACLHVTTETANLMRTLTAGGAEVALCASNPLSTQDDVAAALVTRYGVSTFAIRGEDNDTYYAHINSVIDFKPNITMDDGADVVGILHGERSADAEAIIGGTEETTTGVIRLKSLQKEGRLSFPIVAVNDSQTKHMFDNRYGTGQSTIDGIVRATNILLAGRTFVVAGYGWCGRGLADRARGMGAHVVVTEIDPLRALEAVMDGFRVLPMAEVAPEADFIVTATGNRDVIRGEHLPLLKDGVVLANTGHFNVEIDLDALTNAASSTREVRKGVVAYALPGERTAYLIEEGRLVNLAAAEGHPGAVMDMSFANQALSVEWLVQNYTTMQPAVYDVPTEIDANIAALKLRSEGFSIDQLTDAQQAYLASWDQGT